jgi:hypothetical protein
MPIAVAAALKPTKRRAQRWKFVAKESRQDWLNLPVSFPPIEEIEEDACVALLMMNGCATFKPLHKLESLL